MMSITCSYTILIMPQVKYYLWNCKNDTCTTTVWALYHTLLYVYILCDVQNMYVIARLRVLTYLLRVWNNYCVVNIDCNIMYLSTSFRDRYSRTEPSKMIQCRQTRKIISYTKNTTRLKLPCSSSKRIALWLACMASFTSWKTILIKPESK